MILNLTTWEALEGTETKASILHEYWPTHLPLHKKTESNSQYTSSFYNHLMYMN